MTLPSPLFAGISRVVITPPIGIRMVGYTVQEGCSESIERDLTATALVLSDGVTKTILVACDLAFVQQPHADRIRDRIGHEVGIPAAHVLINASHTHLAPMLPGWQQEAPGQKQLQDRYLGFLEESLTGLAAAANRRIEPARIGVDSGSVGLGINRREKLSDGRVIIGENHQGAIDNELGVVRIDDLKGKPLATIMIAGCHPVVLGPASKALSPDFIGPAREIVESATGASSLFLQGAAANINPICGIGSGKPEQYEDLIRLGSALAGETLKIWAAIRTHNRRGPRRIIQSVATVSVWDYEAQPDQCVDFMGVATRRLTLPLAPLPDAATAERQVAERRQVLQEARSKGASQGVQNVGQRLYEWAEIVARAVADGKKPVRRDLDFWALRVNDFGIVAVSGEPFAELSLEIKRRSPLSNTFLVGYSNGCIGYLPTPEAFAEGGMEVHESYQNYHLPAPLTPEWGPAVVETSLELLNQLQ